MSDFSQSGSPDSTSQGGATEATNSSSQSPTDEMVSKRAVEAMMQKRLKTSHAEIAQLKKQLAQITGEEEVESDKPAQPTDTDWKSKLQRMERTNKSLLDKLDRHRQSTLKAQVQQRLIEKDCIDPEVVFTDLKERGLVKLDDDDNVAIGGVYDTLDELLEDYLSKKDYLRRSKANGGTGSKPPGINAPSGGFDKQKVIDQVRAANTQGKRLFGK